MELSKEFIEFLFFMGGLTIIGYYADWLGLLFEQPNKRVTKRKFLLGIIPFAWWVALVIENFQELE